MSFPRFDYGAAIIDIEEIRAELRAIEERKRSLKKKLAVKRLEVKAFLRQSVRKNRIPKTLREVRIALRRRTDLRRLRSLP